MEKHWERTIPFIQIDNEHIEKLFYCIDTFDGINNVNIINVGCRTSNYIIESRSNHKYLLKLYYKNKQNCDGEKKILDLLKNTVPIQRIYTISKLPWNDNIEYGIYDYIYGETIAGYVSKGNKISEKIVKSVASTLASIHRYKFSDIGFFDYNLNVNQKMNSVTMWCEMDIGDNAQRRLGTELVHKIKEVVKENEKELLELDKEPRLVHGDFQGNNILIKDELVAGIIDWEFAMAGHPIADIGQFFRYNKYFDDRLINIFEKEYNKLSDYKLPNNWYKISRIRDLINLIQLMNVPDDMPIKHNEIKEIIRDTVNLYL